MSLVDQLTVMILTFNEEANIARTLDAIKWAGRIIIIDSGSTDATLEIVRRYQQTQVVTRRFDSFADQCNFGLTQVTTEWVLSLDADYVLSDELFRQVRALKETEPVAGYSVPFIYRICGRNLRGTLYPPRTVLYRRSAARYVNEGHGHRVHVAGVVSRLSGAIYHDDRKPLSRWLVAQQRYAQLEADYLLDVGAKRASSFDRFRRTGWLAPFVALLFVLFIKGCLLDGWPGWYYSLQRLIAESMIALELLDRRLRSRVTK